MNRRIMECVPNFSEGRNMAVIRQITDEIESVEGIRLLETDPGRDTNRTVVTFVGEPDQVVEAAFRAVRKAAELIDMSEHHGEHPRMGATDVCPLVPVSGITMEETVEYARKLARRIGEELAIPVYCYENAAFEEKRRDLANCRAGEYEGLQKKFSDPGWKPDFGPAVFNRRSGATAVGARDFLVAFNINLNTTSTRRANAIAYDVREKGRMIRNENGEKVNIPGSLKKVKAMGWYIEEYGIAQITMNLVDISVTPVHVAFDEVCRKAEARGIRVTGSELVGMIPLRAMLDAGRYFLEKQQRSTGVSDAELIKIAVKSMGLDEIRKFRPEEKIIEFVMEEKDEKNLISMSLRGFMDLTASESPVPGGGSVSAYVGSLGTALGTMVANISSHKRGWDDRWKEFSVWAEKGKVIQNRLLDLVDEDTGAYNMILAAIRMPAKTDTDKKDREEAIENATREASLVPFRVMETAFTGFELIREMVKEGNAQSVTDAAVGAMALRTCITGAFLNVRINTKSLKDVKFADELVSKGRLIAEKAIEEEKLILDLTKKRIF
ncbi:MAG TPA: glutamate formimidoyltransferase [Bacteroidales bacterium]|jgi:glutamate formiminotransferase/formiminotetrahydrofolate cyclodeaminase|nr:glutamate formimidoyltransferase [Bacteroidales bacterium]